MRASSCEGRLSGILDIATHSAPARERKRKLGIVLISSHLSLFGEPGKRTNYFLAGRTSYFNVLTAPQKSAFKSGADTDYNGNLMYDLTAKIDQKLFGDSELSLTIYRSGDQTNRWSRLTDGEERREEKNDVCWGNFLTSLNATFPLSKSWTFQPQFGYSSYRYSLNSFSALSEHRANDWYLLNEDQLESRTSIQTWQTRLDFTQRLGAGHRLHYGFFGSKNGVQPTQNVREEQPPGSQSERIDFTEQALYADYLTELSPQFHLQSGLRGVRYQRSGEDWLFLEPRFNLQWTHRLMLVYFAGYARMSQFLHYLNNPSLGLPTDTWLPASSAAEPNDSRYLVGGYKQVLVSAPP